MIDNIFHSFFMMVFKCCSLFSSYIARFPIRYSLCICICITRFPVCYSLHIHIKLFKRPFHRSYLFFRFDCRLCTRIKRNLMWSLIYRLVTMLLSARLAPLPEIKRNISIFHTQFFMLFFFYL